MTRFSIGGWRGKFNHGCRRLSFAAAIAVLIGVSVPGTAAETNRSETGSEAWVIKTLPLVVLKQSSIAGRVMLLDEDRQLPAKDLPVEIRTSDNASSLYTARTDANGAFTLPNLDKGVYRLKTGRLTVELRIEDQDTFTGSKKVIPKTILIFIPKAMAE